jgi:hypothetical protein
MGNRLSLKSKNEIQINGLAFTAKNQSVFLWLMAIIDMNSVHFALVIGKITLKKLLINAAFSRLTQD